MTSFRELFSTLRRDSTRGSDPHQDSTPGCAAPSTFLRSSTLCSASCLPALFHAGTPLGLRVFRAFPSTTAARSSSLHAALHAVSLTHPKVYEPQLRGIAQSLSPYPHLARFRRQPGRCSLDLSPSRSSPTSLGVLLPVASSHGLSHCSLTAAMPALQSFKDRRVAAPT